MSQTRRVVVQFVLVSVAGCAHAFVPALCPSLSRPSFLLHAHPRNRLPVGQPRVLSAERYAVPALRASISAGRLPGSSAAANRPVELVVAGLVGTESPIKRLVFFALAVCTAVALSFIFHVPAALATSGTAFAAGGAAAATTVGWQPAAKKTLWFALGFIAALPVLSRVARWIGGLAAPLTRALLGRDDCISVTATNVVLSGDEAVLLQQRFQELSFKRDELADRMRWAIRNDVTLRDAKLTVGEVVEDGLGEAAVARQAARMLLSAKHSGGWVAGKVGVNSFLLSQTSDGQEEFFAQCATSRGMMGRFDGAKLAKNRPEGPAQPRVERLKRENEQIREAAQRMERSRVASGGGDSLPLPAFPRAKAGLGTSYGYVDEKPDVKVGAGGVDTLPQNQQVVEDALVEPEAGVGSQKFMIATIVTATVGPKRGGKAGAEAGGPTTSAALEEVSKMTAEQLLSLEVLWLPAEGDRWLTKDEVLTSLDIRRSKGFASAQRLDLFGSSLF